MSDSEVLKAQSGSVLTLTLNRPEKLNALNEPLTEALLAALGEAKRDPSVRVLVLNGSGRGFSSGQDLEAFVRMKMSPTPISVADHLRRGYNLVALALREMEKPVVAAVNGIAAGAGLSLALCCDVRIAADDTVMTLGFSKIGLIPDVGASFLLPLLAGFGRGLELAWTSDRIDANEALRLGLVNRVVAAATLADETAAYAARLAEVSPAALALTKRAFNRSMMPHFAEWLEQEAVLQEEAAAGPDLMEGVQAFMQKRKPAFAAR
jgi:2-(1,2-epoxy-1,2-dihydrophenyl)acetyl-CoA isomerase